ncbi:MAG: hypothetical protein J7623_22715 [Chitinophaga sp.]|uniref:hypothetical protein n=1 Tax=Chitinophaga sp. TaxID=1869181 RepID=UPI001B004AE4|nr:hypothetical protein [Chitinophaga sp.]MBO9731471.1 hypothetical protein [Chitinophaga sp.]
MNNTNYISEKSSKFLLEIIFATQHYYTVSGADLTDNYVDKLLVDTDGSLLLCATPSDVLSLISKESSFFDNETLQEWSRQVTGIKTAYAVIDLDILLKDAFDPESYESVYYTLGVVKDYALQLNDEKLLAIFERDILKQFIDDLADYFTWSENDLLKISVEINILLLSLKEIYERLKQCIHIYQ